VIPNGSTGLCGVRYNNEGKLYLLVYGKTASFNVDPVEKKPLFHFLPGAKVTSIGTLGCNFHCLFCQNWQISQPPREIKEQEKNPEKQLEKINKTIDSMSQDLSPADIVSFTAENKLPAISYTYNEPAIFFEYAFDTIMLGKKQGIKSIFVSNGYESIEAIDLLEKNLDAINIDLKSFNEKFYKEICGAKLENVLEGIKYAFKKNIWIEITTLVIPKHNDSKEELKSIAEFIASIDKNIPWHITAFFPEYKMLDVDSTSREKLFEAYNIGKEAGLNYVYVGNILSEEKENTYCPKCNSLLVKRIYYDIEVKHLDLKTGRCKECNEKIPGVWV